MVGVRGWWGSGVVGCGGGIWVGCLGQGSGGGGGQGVVECQGVGSRGVGVRVVGVVRV